MLVWHTHADSDPEVAILARVPVLRALTLRQTTGGLLCALAMALVGSCEKVPLVAPTESVITLVSNRSVLPINGTAQISATVIEQSGMPAHSGTLVTFTSTLGTLDPPEAVTSNGQATVMLRAGTQSGVATVTAFSGSARSATDSPLTVTIGGAATASMTLTATPGTVPAVGGTVTVTASVVDVDGNRLPGVPVSFSVNAGTLGDTSVLTDAGGQATTTLTTDRETVVTATSGAQTATTTITVSTLPTITVAATPTASSVGEPVTFAVTVTAGSSAIGEASINFGDGTSQSLGALAGATNVVHTYTFAGTFTVTATVQDRSNANVQVVTVIVIEAAAPLNVTLVAPATVQVNVAATFTATVTQPAGTPEIVRYEWDFGDGSSANTTGPAISHVYTSAGSKVASVIAVEKDGRTGSAQVGINVTPATPLNVNLTASPSPGTVDEVVTFTATATGSTVPVATYAWDFGDTTTVTTSGNVVNHVYTTVGTRTVKVTATTTEGVAGSTQISLIVVPLQVEVTLTISPLTANALQTVAFTATVTPATVVVTNYFWEFGDAANTTANTTGRTTAFSYQNADKGFARTVTVTVTTAPNGVTVQTQGVVNINP